MLLKERIPDSFYKLFRTKNMDSYMTCLVALYEESNRLVSSFGLTEEEGRAVISHEMETASVLWQAEEAMEDETPETVISPAVVLNRLLRWGWLRSDYDDRLNENLLSFPEYSQLYIELFEKLIREDDDLERQSLLSVYSALHTYHTEKKKNYQMLSNALSGARKLSQMLSNMQDGMRGYFEELSNSTEVLQVQKVLVSEINNHDSEKYAILTTSDSFYRYKENVKELLSMILVQLDEKRDEFFRWSKEPEQSVFYRQAQIGIRCCDRDSQLVYRIEHEFEQIEKKYNRLIEQKTIFAKRALARLNFILHEGNSEEDSVGALISQMASMDAAKKQKLMEQLQKQVRMSTTFRLFSDDSLYRARQTKQSEAVPVNPMAEQDEAELTDFVPKPLFSRQELQDFRESNMINGRFQVTKETVNSIEDLEKLMFFWQELTVNHSEEDVIELGQELENELGYSFTEFSLVEKEANQKS